MLSFKPTFSLPCLTFTKSLFSSSLLSAVSVVSCAYLRLLIFLPGILFPACASFSQVFHMMCFAYKLSKQSDNIKHWPTPFPILNQSVAPCLVLTMFLDLHTDFSGGNVKESQRKAMSKNVQTMAQLHSSHMLAK